jgi:hypothetical protein
MARFKRIAKMTLASSTTLVIAVNGVAAPAANAGTTVAGRASVATPRLTYQQIAALSPVKQAKVMNPYREAAGALDGVRTGRRSRHLLRRRDRRAQRRGTSLPHRHGPDVGFLRAAPGRTRRNGSVDGAGPTECVHARAVGERPRPGRRHLSAFPFAARATRQASSRP